MQFILTWIKNNFNLSINLSAAILAIINLFLIFFICFLIYIFLHKILLKRYITNNINDKLSHWIPVVTDTKIVNYIIFLILGVVFNGLCLLLLSHVPTVQKVTLNIGNSWCLVFLMLIIFSLMDIVIYAYYKKYSTGNKVLLRGIMQSIKLVIFILIIILIISIITGKSPLFLISGLGAMTAILILIFKDMIMGLIAGIQLSANEMLNLGDWLEMPKYNADGVVIYIGLATVKVKNWDNTISTIPTYSLITDSFKNWQEMTKSGGRRIKRSIYIDVSSIRFLNQNEMNTLKKANLLSDYIENKSNELQKHNIENKNNGSKLNSRGLTNIGTFRAYIEKYLHVNKNIHKGMTIIVRQLDSTSVGVPIEIYAFTNNTNWVEYEKIQSDIFDHIFAIIPEFHLRIFQSPTGYDFSTLSK